MFENPRRGRQARNFSTNVPKILDLKSSSEQIFSESIRWVPLKLRALYVTLLAPVVQTFAIHQINHYPVTIQLSDQY